MPFKAIAFDLDGTLVTEKSSWWKLHEYFGTKDQSVENMKTYEQGKITYDEFMRLDIGLWKPRPHVNTIKEVLLSYHLTPNAKMVTNILKEKGLFLFIVTTAPNILADMVASELNIPYVASNEFTFDDEGYLTQNTLFNVDLLKKELAFEKLLCAVGIKCEECIAVGDSKYDKTFLDKAGLGIAYNPDTILRKETKIIIDDFSHILKFI